MDVLTFILLIAVGLLAGFIDSIAGGGGLITVPVFTLLIGPGATAIGTNKVAAAVASLAALLVYMRAGHVSLKGNRLFAIVVGLSAALGAMTSPHVPPPVYRWLLIAVCPLILWIVLRKDIWVRHSLEHLEHHSKQTTASPLLGNSRALLLIAGFFCGFYDGLAGPGGGTLMFLSLMLIAKLPLLPAMATAKVANLSSASISLASFASSGHVIWLKGASCALGIGVGAVIGALFATRRAAPLARAALVVVASLLAIRLVFS